MACLLTCALFTSLAQPADTSPQTVRKHADQAFQQLGTREQERPPSHLPGERRGAAPMIESNEQQLVGHGQGDLAKGKLICQRVSELAARSDLAKQIRVLIKEHATDRVRERTGREPEQDIEVIREEIVQEYLQGVTIIDRRIDEEAKTCSATAVMPKHRLSQADPGSPH
ncbi:MAG: hypothetical protein U0231_05365 [Nitrospiraceae bacterium]